MGLPSGWTMDYTDSFDPRNELCGRRSKKVGAEGDLAKKKFWAARIRAKKDETGQQKGGKTREGGELRRGEKKTVYERLLKTGSHVQKKSVDEEQTASEEKKINGGK